MSYATLVKLQGGRYGVYYPSIKKTIPCSSYKVAAMRLDTYNRRVLEKQKNSGA